MCFCGTEFITSVNNVKRGLTKSCGCYKKARMKAGLTLTHGGTRTRLYSIFQGIKERCYNENYKAYQRYGGRGIKICDEWRDNFPAFRDWALKNGYEDHLTIDREDNDGNYGPDNCRWVERTVQAVNKKYSDHRNKLRTRGVRATRFNTFIAMISINGKDTYLGAFKTLEEASTAYEKARKERDEMYLTQRS